MTPGRPQMTWNDPKMNLDDPRMIQNDPGLQDDHRWPKDILESPLVFNSLHHSWAWLYQKQGLVHFSILRTQINITRKVPTNSSPIFFIRNIEQIPTLIIRKCHVSFKSLSASVILIQTHAFLSPGLHPAFIFKTSEFVLFWHEQLTSSGGHNA